MSGIPRESSGARPEDNAEQRFGDAYEMAITRKRLFKVPSMITCMQPYPHASRIQEIMRRKGGRG